MDAISNSLEVSFFEWMIMVGRSSMRPAEKLITIFAPILQSGDVPTLARVCGLSERTVTESKATPIREGWLHIKVKGGGRGRGNVYSPAIPSSDHPYKVKDIDKLNPTAVFSGFAETPPIKTHENQRRVCKETPEKDRIFHDTPPTTPPPPYKERARPRIDRLSPIETLPLIDRTEIEDRGVWGERPALLARPDPGPGKAAALDAFNAFNDTALKCGIPQAAKFTPDRERKIIACLKNYGMDGWNQALANIERSAFLTGKNDRGWIATLDFMLQPSKFGKLHDGGYGNGRHAKSSETEQQDLAAEFERARLMDEEFSTRCR
jgi:hypothetical protein